MPLLHTRLSDWNGAVYGWIFGELGDLDFAGDICLINKSVEDVQ